MASGSGSGGVRRTMSGARLARGAETRDYVKAIRAEYKAGRMTKEQMHSELEYVRSYRRNG